MKIAITGKGGVGKTTFTAMLCRMFSDEGNKVFAVDADPDDNLALALGFPQEIIDNIIPITKMKELIEERTACSLGGFGKMFKLNPKVDDIGDEYSHKFNNINLLNLGTVDKGGKGCYCPENVLLKKLISHLILENKEIMIMDMEAGIEHMGRGVAKGVDAFIVVVEPGIRSIQTYEKVKKMASHIGVENIFAIGNKVRNEKDMEYIQNNINKEDILGFIYYNEEIIDSDRRNSSPYDLCEKTITEVKFIKEKLLDMVLK
ncbi:MAG: carbon monoxide dehydrogenase accessory protein CooC [Anaeromicrobium sp.]|jgi:CO dehydrogenase maturation factor|uniref:ATP-binding protein n=1 Tax=Anaeromicrobium sp. TaxID=1929132 RepID=UPI0025F999FB|nr:carbon monoxide dehydrogenase accessory protein CooC [Anaeromicrobium sp.]MCT4595090.1 carbon monoxide dehydrogenase accessory protein CooC [Anaeromicrobium sp.]